MFEDASGPIQKPTARRERGRAFRIWHWVGYGVCVAIVLSLGLVSVQRSFFSVLSPVTHREITCGRTVDVLSNQYYFRVVPAEKRACRLEALRRQNQFHTFGLVIFILVILFLAIELTWRIVRWDWRIP